MDEEKKDFTENEPNFIMIDPDNAPVSGDFRRPAEYREAKEASFEFAPPREEKKERGGSGAGKKILALLLTLALAAGCGYGGALLALHQHGESAAGTGGNSMTQVIKTDGNISTAEAVAAKAIPSVVGISTQQEVNFFSFFGSQSDIVRGVGTGIIVSEDGYIVTNSHVISNGEASEITVQLTDGRELPGKLLWYDSSIDLAVLKVEATGLTPAELGDSDQMNIGSYALAIGNPLGMDLDRSVTQGIISGLDRTIQVSSGSSLFGSQSVTMENMIQTDAAINSGNSGGPLLNQKGQVIGINTATTASADGLGFAIPINTAKNILEEVMAQGSFEKAYVGVSGIDLATYNRYFPQYSGDLENGIYVMAVINGSPAAIADLRVGDILISMDGEKLSGMTDLQKQLFNYAPGDTVEFKLLRNGEEMTLSVVLGGSDEAPAEDEGSNGIQFPDGTVWQK